MRSLLLAAAVVVGALLGAGTQPAPIAAATPPKVAIIVGPVGSSTAGYKRDADAAAAEALKYTPNVIKVYTPNATWAAAKAAMQDASIVIYMGHGNGFPSPYTTALAPDRQNGLGLNPTAGGDDSATKYYGEDFLRNEVRLAPNAVVILGHLCYASGTSEPGKAAPTDDQARQRVDNYAAGFLAAGARTVIAEAYGSAPAAYVRAMFTTSTGVQDMWLNSASAQGNVFSFASMRSPGMTVHMDPDKSSGKYYRSYVGDPALQTTQVSGGFVAPPVDPNAPPPSVPSTPSTPGTPSVPPPTPTAPPSVDPGVSPPPPAAQPIPVVPPPAFSVPGAATVTWEGAPVFADASLPVDPNTGTSMAALPAGTPVRLLADAGTAPDGSRIFNVTTTDGAMSGFMVGTSLQPADSGAPVLLSISVPTAFSPNGDGYLDTVLVGGQLSKAGAWQLTISGPTGTLSSNAGNGSDVALSWDGTVNGQRLPDGIYTWQLSATDAWGNGPLVKSGSVAIDTTPPTLAPAAAQTSANATFSPNGDGVKDSWTGLFTLGGVGTVDAAVSAADGTLVRRLSANATSAGANVAWDGRSDAGSGVADGTYLVMLTARDAAGNQSAPITLPVAVYRALSSVTASTTVFYPQDGDSLAPSTRLGFALSQNATVTWQIVDATGKVVFSKFANAALAPRSVSMVWAGRDQANAVLPVGRYEAILTATNGTLTDTVRTPLWAAGFAVTTSATSVRRGGSVTITAVSAEPLKGAAKMTMARPGLAAQTFPMTKVGPNTYRVTLRLSNTGKAGTMSLKFSGVDTKGGTNTTAATLAVK